MAYFYLTPLSSLKDDQLARLLKNLRDLEDLLNGKITADNIAARAITGALVALNTLLPENISGNPQSASGSFVGDGTANKIVIPLSWVPRYALIAKQDDGTVFEALSDGSTGLTNWWRVAAGTQGSGAADFQGIVASGVKGGSAVAPLSNKNGTTYYYYCSR